MPEKRQTSNHWLIFSRKHIDSKKISQQELFWPLKPDWVYQALKKICSDDLALTQKEPQKNYDPNTFDEMESCPLTILT